MKKNWFVIALIVSFVALGYRFMSPNKHKAYAEQKVTAETPDKKQKYLIVPGKSVGPVKLGDSMKSVHKILGSSPGVGFMNGPAGSGTESYPNGLAFRYNNNKVVEIIVRSKPYATAAKGISVGSSPKIIRGVFKGGIQTPYRIKYRKPPITIYLYHDIKRGIAFWFGDNAKNSTAGCDTIIVHRPGSYMGGSMPDGS